MILKDKLPRAHFGAVGTKSKQRIDDTDADDREYKRTPPDVVGMLGFDPKNHGQKDKHAKPR